LSVEIRRISYNSPAADAIRAVMDAEMGALYADVGPALTDELQAHLGAALTVHPEDIVAAVGAFDGDRLVGHAALRPFEESLEVKRVIVLPEYRGHGISKLIMAELEEIARERGVHSLVLQTGDRQQEAIALYERLGYVPIPRFGHYAPIPFFLCFGKQLIP
jgi:GNAT superfamily N-acetyltransferase